MVELREVEDEHFVNAQPAPSDDEDDYTDTDSEISEEDEGDDVDLEESLYERVIALKDMIPLKQRTYISNGFSRTYGFFSKGFALGGKTLWILSTSALVLGVPFAVAITDEQQVAEMEKEMKMNRMTTDALTPGAESILTAPQK
ncbi:mitochondrial import translocase, subunit Tom22 [Choiromyces venosus 120613-1]|uniref:Mitochondrial import translocase, subunit Tom22 n=1 Tax=Choiromyces venosus 120613-1 TaxID=1336337 RepID=A0A3N4K2I1_9PEZI|nr:mitochondrial import translocase, subunit Tom22 [Choiromyces venosus 120613-1]